MKEKSTHWMSGNILPFEPDLRRWIRRSSYARRHEDDLIQEAYFRIARAGNFERVRSGRAYFFTVVKNLIIERLRREKLVRIDAMAEIETLFILDDTVTIEQELLGREELAIVNRLLKELPLRCREVFYCRRVRNLSQRETAGELGVSENVVEKQTALGLHLLMSKLAATAHEHGYSPHERLARRERKQNRRD